MKLNCLVEGQTYSYKFSGGTGYGIFTGDFERVDTQCLAVIEHFDGSHFSVGGGALTPCYLQHDRDEWLAVSGQSLEIENDRKRRRLGQHSTILLPPSLFHYYRGTCQVIRFATELELWFVAQMEKRSTGWIYEEKLFVFEDGSGFCPDFYLEEIDTYVELTCQPRRSKTAKLRRMARGYPSVNVTCLARNQLFNLSQEIDSLDKYQLLEWVHIHKEQTTFLQSAAA